MNNNASEEMYAALSKFQGEVENATKDSNNPHFKSKYADLATVWDTIRAPLAANGLSIIQLLESDNAAGGLGLRTVVGHKGGGSLTTWFLMPCKDATNPQALGSSVTYCRRYSLMAVAGIGAEDDDGNSGSGHVAKPQAAVNIPETMAVLEKATDEEARALYAAVRNKDYAEPGKTELLTLMAASIKGRLVKK